MRVDHDAVKAAQERFRRALARRHSNAWVIKTAVALLLAVGIPAVVVGLGYVSRWVWTGQHPFGGK